MEEMSAVHGALLLQLGVADLVVSLTQLVTLVAPRVCAVAGFWQSSLQAVVLFTVCGLNLERYVAIVEPLGYKARPGRVRLAAGLAGAWAAAALVSAAPLVGLAPAFDGPFCNVSGWFALLFYSLVVVLPSLLVLGCNFKIYRIARYHRHCIASAIFQVTISAHATITHQPFQLARGRAKRAAMTVCHVLACDRRGMSCLAVAALSTDCIPPRNAVRDSLVCLPACLHFLPSCSTNMVRDVPLLCATRGSLCVVYWPQVAVATYETAAGQPAPEGAAVAARCLQSLASAANAFVYGVKSRSVRHSFLKAVRRKLYQSDVHQEIRAREHLQQHLQQGGGGGGGSRRASGAAGLVSAAIDKRKRGWLLRRQSFLEDSGLVRSPPASGSRLNEIVDKSNRSRRQAFISRRSKSCGVLVLEQQERRPPARPTPELTDGVREENEGVSPDVCDVERGLWMVGQVQDTAAVRSDPEMCVVKSDAGLSRRKSRSQEIFLLQQRSQRTSPVVLTSSPCLSTPHDVVPRKRWLSAVLCKLDQLDQRPPSTSFHGYRIQRLV
ncbi:unnamed protein product [Notodromas monacha]|uniref:G-protein coupled receptors family 1 profile domain-containing protein n=1 Tax=Notodromas monacha TaxID=399045 RepID=A0A7R9BTB1_9CRUS|nr:unnamed protein product [Notodromas monacha]CAG0919971.1 unnamed protein product [Notodromas monacha]